MIRRTRRILAPLVGFCLLTACPSEPKDPEACLPETVDQLVDLQRAGSTEVASAGEVRVYVDGSGSMAGFARAGQPGNTPFQDVIDSLGQLTASRAGNPRIRFFRLSGDQVPELREARAQIQEAIRSPDFYLCRGAVVGEGCSFQSSRTTLVFDRIAQAPEADVSIFVSDLWFSDDQVRSQPGVALRGSLAQILQTRDIAIYGFRAPYSGTLDDLPSGDDSVRPPSLPFYLVIAGPPARVREIRRNFERPGSRWLRDNLGRERLPFSIFSTSTLATEEQSAQRFELGENVPGIRRDTPVWREQQARIPDQFVITRDRVRDTSTGPVWRWPTALPPRLVWTGNFAPSVEVRRIQDRQSCDILDPEQYAPEIRRVTPPAASPSEVAPPPSSGSNPMFSFSLDPRALIDRLGPGEWIIAGKIQRTSVQENNPATQWLRDWSFEATVQSEMSARRHADFFPTLNVAEFARLMEYAVDDAARRNGRPVAGFVTILRIE